jgi:dihydrofolate reductase
MKVALIVAMDHQRGIGKNNDLMWHLPADMQFFKSTTSGHVVVTGRKNYDSIPERFRPLPNRENAVLTRNEAFEAPGAICFSSLNACLEHYKNEDSRTIFIIGGGQIYTEAMESKLVDEMYITQVDGTFGADTFFPEFNLSDWKAKKIMHQAIDEKHHYAFDIMKFTRN